MHEPCAAYSQCSTCTSDAFCGWSGSEDVCVEGDSEGPLTGHDRDNKWVWSDCAALGSATAGGATGGMGVDGTAASALKSAEKSVESLEKGDKTAIASEQKMVKDEKKAFNVIKHLRAVIKAWRGRQAEISNAEHKDRELFQSAFTDAGWFERTLRSSLTHTIICPYRSRKTRSYCASGGTEAKFGGRPE